jgi:parallel beta-helix repeat protein
MKRLIILILIVIFPVLVYSQFTGSGTYSNPYSGGTLTGDQTWAYSSSPIYVSGDLTVGAPSAAGHLTIEAGVIILFVSTGADLIITGLGELTADGTLTSKIRFTSDNDKDGNYAEAGETWGHISFQSMGSANPSSITFCIIECGRKDGNKYTLEGVGGGLQVAYNNITISDNIFRSNYSSFGGALFINQSSSPSIVRCFFKENYANEGGGGIYLYASCNSLISNCIFDNNFSKGFEVYYYSGGAIMTGASCTGVKILNSTFVNNNSDRAGDALYIYSSTTVRNCIFWGSSDQVAKYGSTYGTFNNVAIQGTVPSGFYNSISLNSVNNASDGPNFVATDGSDWSIKFISPCRDAGTTPNPAVPTDYAGKSRISLYDIGAYEVQYSRWTGATNTSWSTSTNWEANVDPSSGTGDAIIPTGLSIYPVNASNPDFIIGSGKQMIIEQGARVTLDDLTNNGTLKLNHTTAGFASLIINSYTKGGGATEEIQLYLSGGGTKTTYKWHYISTPVSSLPVSTFAPGTTLDLAQFVESRPTLSLREGWIAYDGYSYSGGPAGPPFSDLTPGKGYDYWDNADNTFTFSGQLNTGNFAMSLGFSGDATLHGFNLLGNPFSSGLNWNDIVNNVYFTYPSNTSKGLYFTRDNTQCTYIAGVGIPSDVSGIIPPMQGFFTKTYSTGNTITLPAAARTHDNIHARYKGSSVIPLIRLSLTDDTLSDETVVRFDENAKADFDYDFDALKAFLNDSLPSIYSVSSGVKYAINGQPFPGLGTPLVLPITINLTSDTSVHTITASQLQGLTEYDVFLTDYSTGYTADLKQTPSLTFSSPKGKITGRFVLSCILTGTENTEINQTNFNIYPAYNYINIQTVSDEWDNKTGTVKVLDMAGKTVSYLQNTEFTKNSVTQVRAPASRGLYFIEIKSGMKRYVGKIVIR